MCSSCPYFITRDCEKVLCNQCNEYMCYSCFKNTVSPFEIENKSYNICKTCIKKQFNLLI